MNEFDYAYAVARIRANEASLLNRSDFEALITAANVSACIDVLASKGLTDHKGEQGWSLDGFVREQSEALWNLLSESVPDKTVLGVFCVKNDFFNLKAALKCALSGLNFDGYFRMPSSFDIEALREAVKKHDFEALGEPYSSVCSKAYDAAMKTENGQSLDVIVDRAALEVMHKIAEDAHDEMTARAMNLLVACADIKIAVRAARAGKPKSFIDQCLCPCSGLDVEKLAACASSGEKDVFDLLARSDYSEGAALLKESGPAFEKWCDDKLISIVSEAKYKFFGFEPVLAYYYAKTNEIKMIRLIISAKQSKLSEDLIRERMRRLYV